MSFCKFSTEVVVSNSTTIDNLFITDYMPSAPESCIKVYLFGLCKCSSNSIGNSIENFSKELGLAEDDILSAYYYWQEQGLVQVLNTFPIEVRYMPVKNAGKVKKYDTNKYSNFNAQAQEIIQGRMITPTEYEAYYTLFEVNHLEPEALIMIMKYCTDLKTTSVGYSYIITVAKNWINENILTAEQVENRLVDYEKFNDEVKQILSNIGSKRNASVEERELYIKWTNQLDFSVDLIISIVKIHKKNKSKLDFYKLDSILLKYYNMKLYSIEEIKEYEDNKQELLTLAKVINKTLGVYYETLDPVIENYISKWLAMGFSEESLIQIANFSFQTSIRTLEGMDTVVSKFYKLGLLSIEAIEGYLQDVIQIDNQIKQILVDLDISRGVNTWDREFYKNWTTLWNMPKELIDYAVTLAKGKIQPMQYLNKILSSWFEKKITTLEQAKKCDNKVFSVSKNNGAYKNKNAEPTKQDISALFDSLEEFEV